jgi:hypothetical protein
MSQLRDEQIWMVSAITGAEVDAEGAGRHVTPSAKMTASERLDVYRAGYKLRLVDCLKDDYPVLAGTLGDDDFDALARAYVDRHPSSSPNLNFFGRHMPAFCREHRGVFASELAALEWALVEVLHAETAPPLDVSKLQALPLERWETARFAKSDALRVFRFEHPVNAYFQSRWVDESDAPVPAPSPTALAVYRRDTRLWRMDLTPPMAAILFPLVEGATFGEALARLEADVKDPEALATAAQKLMVWFREWVDNGFFARVDLA